MRGIFSSLLLGAFIAHYGLTVQDSEVGERGLTRQTHYNPGTTETTSDGYVSGGEDAGTDSQFNQARLPQGYPMVMPFPASNGRVPSGYVAPRPEIAGHVEAGVQHLDTSARELPVYIWQVANEVEKHGIAALAYENPELKKAGNRLGNEIGAGIRNFASAVAKDMGSAGRPNH